MSKSPPLVIVNVDDDDANRYFLSRTLQKAGYEVQEASTGAEALRLAALRPALILLDVKLPDISGFEVCRRIKATPGLSSIPVLHLSASYTSSSDKAQGLEGGADGYLVKPAEPVELLATIHALLRLSHAEEAARLSTLEWSATFEAIGDGLCLLDAEGKILRANRALADLLRIPQSQLPGRLFPALFHDRFGSLSLPDIVGVHATRQRLRQEVDTPDLSLYISADPVINEQNVVTGVVAILTDISERRRLQREDQQRRAEVEELNARLKRAMAETHHRVKNNLQVISALVDMQVMEDKSAIPVAEWQRLGIHIRTLAAVHDLLTAAVKNNQEADDISVSAAMERLLPMLQATVGRRRLRAEIDDISLPARSLGSLTILVNELISNAVKHGEGEIHITFSVAREGLSLEVCDDGPGFPPDFDPRKAANTGLELIDSTARHDLQGEIAFTNRPEGGARVIVTLPPPGKNSLEEM